MLVPPLAGIAPSMSSGFFLLLSTCTIQRGRMCSNFSDANRGYDLVQRDMQTMKQTAAELARGVGSKEAVMNSLHKAQGEDSSEH